MIKEFQDNNWNRLSEESKSQIISVYKGYINSSNAAEKGTCREIEDFYGKHNIENYIKK